MDTHNSDRYVSAAYIDRVSEWIRRIGEVFIILRYLRAAGAKDFAFCRSQDDFESLVQSVPTGTDIEVFRDLQLPLRGVVDDAFMAAALGAITDGKEYLLVSVATRPGSIISVFGKTGDSNVELLESLKGLRTTEVAVGACPAFNVEDHDGLITAAKGGIDGPR